MGFKPSQKPTKKHKKGLWSPEEDQRLKDYIIQHGIGCWSSVPLNAGKFYQIVKISLKQSVFVKVC